MLGATVAPNLNTFTGILSPLLRLRAIFYFLFFSHEMLGGILFVRVSRPLLMLAD